MKELFDLTQYLRPVWDSDEIVNETFMFLGEEDEAPFLFPPEKVVFVSDYFLGKTYVEGRDYALTGGGIKRLKGGAIPFFAPEEYYTTEKGHYGIEVDPELSAKLGFTDKRYLAYGECDAFTRRQVAATYRTRGAGKIHIPEDKSAKFSAFSEKIKRGGAAEVVWYGDSIMTGCNSSGTPMGGNVPPYMPSFPELFARFIGKAYGADIVTKNVSQGGWNTYDAFSAFDERVANTSPDLFVLGFGMNDLDTPPEDYERMYSEMISAVRAKNPRVGILLVSTMLPNPDSTWLRNQVKTLPVLEKFERNGVAAVADVQSVHKSILSVKRYRDCTANNINHPNDFMARIYAQVILKTVLGAEYEKYFKEI